MISENELVAAIVTVEQSIRDADEGKHRFKQDGAKLADLSMQLTASRAKLQTLHCVQGISTMMTANEIHLSIAEVQKAIDGLNGPVETNLFSAPDSTKEIERRKSILKAKLSALKFAAGEEKKIV
jgi:hypothetical protein